MIHTKQVTAHLHFLQVYMPFGMKKINKRKIELFALFNSATKVINFFQIVQFKSNVFKGIEYKF